MTTTLYRADSTFLDALADALRTAAAYNRNDQVPPAAVLWTDQERRWESVILLLRAKLPVLTLGLYNPETLTGPAIWLRCMIARTLPEADWPANVTPILYLPGVSKQQLRAVEECPRHLQPLAELQYRGVLWIHRNGKDWTPSAFLQSADGGLGIEIVGDTATREALQRALTKLVEEPVADIRAHVPLSAAYFRQLIEPDPIRSLLLWMNDPLATQRNMEEARTWDGFREICRAQFGIDPVAEGAVGAAMLLGEAEGIWETVWQRYAEAPTRYPQLPNLLKRAYRPPTTFFEKRFPWPQANEEQEAILRKSLLALDSESPKDARRLIRELEAEHGDRRGWVWAELGQAPLALALPALVRLADATSTPLTGETPSEIARSYTEQGWQADAAVLDALAAIERTDDVTAVKQAVRSLYSVWLRDVAETFQTAVKWHGLSAPAAPTPSLPPKAGHCWLFADGLRYDVGQRLVEALQSKGFMVSQHWQFTAMPGVTPTAKPAVTPVAEMFGSGPELTPTLRTTGTKVSIEVLRRVLEEHQYVVLRGEETGVPNSAAWTEYGTLDSTGHTEGWKLAHRIAAEVRALADRVAALLDAGWTNVQIVTDHGWLLLPGNLPSVSLPIAVTEIRKGRCARLKSTAHVIDQQTLPWHWDQTVQIAFAPGISCYEAGKEYEHGGLSPQECVVPVLMVSRSTSGITQPVTIESVTWRNLRCMVKLVGSTSGMTVDIRTKPGNPATSITTGAKAPDANGMVSLLIPDEDQLESAAQIVVLAEDGTVHTQMLTTVGG